MKIKFLQANNGDSILISFKDNEDIKRNILIDGGMPSTYYSSGHYGKLHQIVGEIQEKKERIDLLILTHIDADHIGGILKWFEMDKEAYKLIGKVWFNSGKTIANYFEEKENKDLNVPINIFDTNYTSVGQGKDFEDYIEENNIWDKEIIKCEKIADKNGVKIQLLSPNNKLLKKLLKEYKKPKHDYFTSGKKKDWETAIVDFIDEEKKPDFKYKKDNSVSNGSSIAFLLTFMDKNFLFLGDAHPDIILTSLNELNYNKENPIQVELLKVSHHGSCKNTNKELLEVIETNNYILSTNSETHNHPDKRTIARIINRNPNATIYFNYDNVKTYIFSNKDYTDFPDFKAKNSFQYKVE